MNGSRAVRRTATAVLAAVVAAAVLGGCGDDEGAGAQGSTGNLGPASPTGPGSGDAVLAVVVSGAIPVSGNAAVTGGSGTAAAGAGTLRTVVADGTGGGLQHRFTVTFDAVSGVVISILHAWGPSGGAAEATVGCVRTAGATVPVAEPSLCLDGASVDLVAARVTFADALLRNGSFSSILNGQVPFAVP
jgi:hypothetical protein